VKVIHRLTIDIYDIMLKKSGGGELLTFRQRKITNEIIKIKKIKKQTNEKYF